MTSKLLPILSCVLMVMSLSAAKTNDASGTRLPTKEQLEAVQQRRAVKMKLKAAVERPMKAAEARLKREKLESLRQQEQKRESPKRERDKLLRTLRSFDKWQRFGHRGSHSAGPLLRGGDGPTVLINGASAATIGAGEAFEISITFTTGEDSAWAELFFDADGDTVVDAEDISLLEILAPGPKMMPGGEDEGSFWIYDNSDEDEDPAAGEFVETIDDFPFMGISMIFQVTDGGGSGQAYLTVDNLTGDYAATGTVSPVTATALVMFSHEFEDEPFMTFTDNTGAFSFDFLNLEGGFFLGAMDAALGISSGEHLLSGQFYEHADELDGVTLDITRDAAIVGSVVDEEDGTGIEDASVAAFSGQRYDILMGFTTSGSDGGFSLPLQGGHLYEAVEAYHPDYMWNSCIDYPVYVSSGDTLDFDCELEEWPAFVEGYVTDAEAGDPLEDVAVEIRMWDHDGPGPGGPMMGDDDDRDMEGFWNEAWTDEEGYYRLGTVYGTGELCAHDWDDREYQGYCEFGFLVDESLIQYDFQLELFDGAITGTVTDVSTGDPLPRADVWAYAEEWMFDQWDMTAGDGKYKLPVVNGTYTVCAEKWWEQYGEECVENVVVLDNTVTVDIALSPPDGVIQGYVYDADTDEAVKGIGVDAFGDEYPYYYYYGETDESGFFKLGVNNGTYEVCFYDWDWTNTYEDTCLTDIVVSDDTQEITVNLTPIDWDGAIVGSVADEYGNSIESGVIAIDTTEWEANWAMSDRDGRYVLPLNNGTYVAAALPFRWGYLWDVEYNVVVDLDTVDVDFVLPLVQIDAMIDGTVTDTLGNILEDAWVEAGTWFHFGFDWWWGDGLFFDTETDESGTYELDVMGFDDQYYWIYADYWDPETEDFMVGFADSVWVQSGETVSVDLVLRPIMYGSEICGYVSINGEPAEGAEVWAEDSNTGEFFVTYTDEDGYFCMGVVNGEYDVCATIDEHMVMCSYVELFDERESMDFEFSITIGVSDEASLPERFALHQNSPNPFNPVTTIQYDLPEGNNVELIVYDILGHEVAVLVDGRQAPGYHTVKWDGTDRSGSQVATGVYIYQLKAQDFVRTKKLILLR
ncbi:MAG: FlgD immunoglobulin-like domain containing protein [Candidatus Neomarinimicrobiota bacterium]